MRSIRRPAQLLALLTLGSLALACKSSADSPTTPPSELAGAGGAPEPGAGNEAGATPEPQGGQNGVAGKAGLGEGGDVVNVPGAAGAPTDPGSWDQSFWDDAVWQ